MLGSPAEEAAVDQIEAAVGADTWRVLLPRLRAQARVKRSELVHRLAAILGVPEREEKVGRYYNAMEHEQLDPDGVSASVFEALAGIVGVTAETLRNAAPGPPEERVASVAYARLAPWDVDADAVAASPTQAPELDWDEVDELFRGG
jgi:hypothetical protein